MSNRNKRYRNLVRGWDWRTSIERMNRIEKRRNELGLTKTEYLEFCIDKELGMNTPKFEIKNMGDNNVSTVTYEDGTMFTVRDWQGPQPNADEIEKFDWYRVNPDNPSDENQWTPAVMLLGWPRVL